MPSCYPLCLPQIPVFITTRNSSTFTVISSSSSTTAAQRWMDLCESHSTTSNWGRYSQFTCDSLLSHSTHNSTVFIPYPGIYWLLYPSPWSSVLLLAVRVYKGTPAIHWHDTTRHSHSLSFWAEKNYWFVVFLLSTDCIAAVIAAAYFVPLSIYSSVGYIECT